MRDIPKKAAKEFRKSARIGKKRMTPLQGVTPKCRIKSYNFSLPLPPWYFCIRARRV